MPSNPNIALSFKSPQFRSPLETAARAQQLATNAMTMQKTQREAASLNALRDYIGGGGTLDTPEAVSAAIKAGANPDTVRALAAQNLDVGKFQAERKKVAAERLFNRLGAVDRAGENGDDQPWVDWVAEYGALGPEEAAEAKAYLNITGGRYDPAIVKSLMAGAVEFFKKTVPQATTESLISETGDVGVLTRGGLGAPTIKTPRTMVPDSRKGTVSVEPSVTVDETAPVSAEDAEAFIASFPREAQAAIRQRVNQGALGNIPMGSPVSGNLVAGERGGVGGPDEGYVEAPTPFRAKNPSVSPYPGSAQVPITRVREEAVAQRKTPTETYAETRSAKQAESDVKFLDSVGSSKDQARNVLSVIDQMIGDLNVEDGKIVTGERPPHPGFESVVGAGIPGLRFIPGTQSADFDAFMEQVEGGAFLDAYESLRGTGQITQPEGEKATRAIARMKRSSSEVGFVKAAREFADIVRRGLERAEAREARLLGTTPTAKSSGGKRLRYNPATGELE